MSKQYILVHHGIDGQKWGVRNGPPYPLRDSQHSARERRAEKKYGNEKSGFNYKKAAKIGAVAVGTALAAYGGYYLYKSGAIDDVVKLGKKEIDDRWATIMEEADDAKYDLFGDILPGDLGGACNPQDKANNCKDVADSVLKRWTGADPSAVAGEKSMTGNLHDWVDAKYDSKGVVWINELGGIMPDKTGDSTKKVKDAILKKFGNGDCGSIGVNFDIEPELKKQLSALGITEEGHVFNWYIDKGDVIFYDDQPTTTLIGKACSDKHLTHLDLSKEIEIVKITKDAFAK